MAVKQGTERGPQRPRAFQFAALAAAIQAERGLKAITKDGKTVLESCEPKDGLAVLVGILNEHPTYGEKTLCAETGKDYNLYQYATTGDGLERVEDFINSVMNYYRPLVVRVPDEVLPEVKRDLFGNISKAAATAANVAYESGKFEFELKSLPQKEGRGRGVNVDFGDLAPIDMDW